MHVVLAILQGMGLAAAAGMRPFLPALLAGSLARADAGLDFEHTPYAFLERPGWLIAMGVGMVVLAIAEQRRPELVRSGPVAAAIAGLSIGIGGLLCAGSLADVTSPSWPGLPAGIACAALAQTAVAGLLGRTRARLDAEAARALPLYAEGAALALAGLSVLAPPVSLLALGFLAWLLVGLRRREGGKYAGLRILR